jgi:ATP/maltotriose-dependent transcriptional regulator MalT
VSLEPQVVDQLLERERELGALTALASRASAGAGQLAIVRGPAGCGKTRLLAAARDALAARADVGFLAMQPYFLAVVAELAVDAGRLDVAEALLAEGRALAASSGERIAEPELARVTGRLALARGDRGGAEAAFARALDRARVVGTPVAAVHAARELAEMRAAAGALAEARALVAAVLDELPDGEATAGVAAARALLDRLASGAYGTLRAAA